MIILISLLTMGSFVTYHHLEWKHVGYHECKQVGILEPENATVYPAQVAGGPPYILFKQKNKNGTYTVGCINEPTK